MRAIVGRMNNLMTLGELITFLEAVSDKEKNVVTSGGTYVSGFTSYRGYYEELAITPTNGYSDEGAILNVGELLEKAKEVDGSTLEGWKGGSYLMTKDNGLWLAHSGQSSGIGLKKAKEREYAVVLYGKACDC